MGDDHKVNTAILLNDISIHVPRMGDDLKAAITNFPQQEFLSTSPVWGTTRSKTCIVGLVQLFLSTSPVWGTTVCCLISFYHKIISIHVPRMGDDGA